MNRKFPMLVAAAVLSLTLASVATAEDPAHTTINVEKMCCNGCAKKIAGQLYVVKGVKEVRVDLKQKLVFVIPTQNATVSPKAIWEAVVKGEDNPLRLAGPSGTFTEKPQF